MVAKHLIVCGHGAGDPGAGGNGITERDWTRNSLKPLMEKWAKQLKHNTVEFYPVSNNMFVDTQAGRGAYTASATSVTEIHLDSSSNSSATGGHVIIHTSLSADGNDLAIAQVINKYVGWWGSVKGSQGISRRNNLLNCNVFATRAGISYRLVELGFISNPTDVRNLINNLDAVAKELVEAVTGEKLSVAPEKPKQPTINQGTPGTRKGLFYRSHVPNQGWLGFMPSNGTSGSTGLAIPLEAVDVRWDGKQDMIGSQAHVAGVGWKQWDYGVTGTTGENRTIEAVKFWIGAELKKAGYSIEYRVHVRNIGWMSWVKDGEVAGTTGKGLPIEAIQMRMYKNGKPDF